MTANDTLIRHGHRLLQIGIALLLFSWFDDLAIPYLASPRLGLSVHTLSALQSVLLLGLGGLDPFALTPWGSASLHDGRGVMA